MEKSKTTPAGTTAAAPAPPPNPATKVAVTKQHGQPTGTWPSDFLAPFTPFARPFPMNPFAMMREFTNQLDRAFPAAFQPMLPSDTELAAWSPVIEVRQHNGDLVVTAEVPGLTKEEVKVELTDDALIIQGDRKREHEEDRKGFHCSERSYGHFYRSIALPEGAKADQVKAELHDGVLKVTLPVPPADKKSRAVPITEH